MVIEFGSAYGNEWWYAFECTHSNDLSSRWDEERDKAKEATPLPNHLKWGSE